MAMLLLVARRFPRKVTLSVHLDTTKTIPDPQNAQATIPDPAWVLTQTWPLPPRAPGEAAGAYTTRLSGWATATKAEFRQACLDRLQELTDALDPGVALPGEGQAF